MVPMIVILSCLITALVFVMIIVTLVKKSSEYGKNMQTHVGFNKNLDTDIEPDIVNHTKQSLHKVYSLDQLNQVSFEGFTSVNSSLAQSKYNTLPARQIAIIESVYSNQAKLDSLYSKKFQNFHKNIFKIFNIFIFFLFEQFSSSHFLI